MVPRRADGRRGMTAFEGYEALRAAKDIGNEPGTGEPTIAKSTLARLRPVRLLLHHLGPFRGPEPTAIGFQTPRTTTERGRFRPCDVLVVCGDNGTGKSSLLNAIHGLFGLMSSRPTGMFSRLDDATGPRTSPAMLPSARLDMLAVCTIDGQAQRVLMTLWHGGDQPPVAEGDAEALERPEDGFERVLLGFRCGSAMAAGTNEAGRRILYTVRATEGCTLFDHFLERGIGGEFVPLPTAIQFRHGRPDVGGPTSGPVGNEIVYRPARRFDPSEGALEETARRLRQLELTSLQGLLEEFRDAVFLETHGASGLALIPGRRIRVDRSSRHRHGFEGLGSGETALLTIQANGWLHMTASALLLIDDLDAWIARRWHEKVCLTTLQLALGRAGAMLVLTTHDPRFASKIVEAATELGLACATVHLSVAVD